MVINREDNRRAIYDFLFSESRDQYKLTADGTVEISREETAYTSSIDIAERMHEFVDSACTPEVALFLRSINPENDRARRAYERLVLQWIALEGILHALSAQNDSDAKVDLFLQCWNDAWNPPVSAVDMDDSQGPIARPNERELFVDFVRRIQARASEKKYRSRSYAEKRKFGRRLASVHQYVCGLFRNYNALLVLRLDLRLQEKSIFSSDASDAKRILSRFLNNSRGRPLLFRHLLGHIWRLEFHPNAGFFFHVVLVFDGHAELRTPTDLSKEIGAYWVKEICDNQGDYFDWSLIKEPRKSVGIGRVRWNDDSAIQTLKQSINILAESERYVRAKCLAHERCFGMGNLP